MTFNDAYEICRKKAYLHIEKMNGNLFEPLSNYEGDYYDTKHGEDISTRYVWLPSFVTGMGILLFHTNGDKAALKWANQFAGKYHDKVFQDYSPTMHDLGFLYLPYSVYLYQLTGAHEHRETALRAAEELAKRFDVRGHYIEAWSEMTTEKVREGRMIVDSAMNVPLLFWAWKETGHSFYHDIAVVHLETIMKTLIRDDASVSHSWIFDLNTGEPLREANSCGYANGSHWARGTAWLVFGLAIAYEYTLNKEYFDTAVKVAEKYLSSLDNGPIPTWDFRLPKEFPAKSNTGAIAHNWDESLPENRTYNVDTSAAAIMTCAFQLVTKHQKLPTLSDYIKDALTVLGNQYLNTDTSKTGMLCRANGNDTYAIYGDYYYMLALAVELYDIETCWGHTE